MRYISKPLVHIGIFSIVISTMLFYATIIGVKLSNKTHTGLRKVKNGKFIE